MSFSFIFFVIVSAFLLTEDDYLAAEPDGFIPLRVERDPSTRLANPVTVRVTPMTVAMAIQRGIIDDSFPDSVISPNRARKLCGLIAIIIYVQMFCLYKLLT